mmetsp:Transcript_21105/g.18713  ORF Transcript_21105/g.18713 Transcript_21105/m.18713 type:complete len:111 (-) Transcript_21105:392-724(-)
MRKNNMGFFDNGMLVTNPDKHEEETPYKQENVDESNYNVQLKNQPDMNMISIFEDNLPKSQGNDIYNNEVRRERKIKFDKPPQTSITSNNRPRIRRKMVLNKSYESKKCI